jgi:hypothetical protein
MNEIGGAVMKTADEIQHVLMGLDCCGDQEEGRDELCDECPYNKVDCACARLLCSDAAALIRQLTAERDAAIKDLEDSAPCFACRHFHAYSNRECYGGGRCNIIRLAKFYGELSPYPETPDCIYGFEWRGVCAENSGG